MDAGGGGQRVESLLLEEVRPNLVEYFVVALDIAQIAGGPDYILPSGALGFQQLRDVVVGPPGLGAEIPYVDASAVLIDAGSAGDQQDGDALDIQAQTAREGRGFGVMKGFVQDLGGANRLFGDDLIRRFRCCDGFRDWHKVETPFEVREFRDSALGL